MSEPEIWFGSISVELGPTGIDRSVRNMIYIQKADFNTGKNTLAGVDPGARMDAKAAYDKGYFQRIDQKSTVEPV